MLKQLFDFLNSHLLLLLTIHVFLLCLFSVLNFKAIIKYFSGISKKTWAILALIFIAGFFLRVSRFDFYGWFPVHEYAIFLQKMGIMTNQCFFGNYETCLITQGALHPPGYPFLAVIYNVLLGFNSLSAAYISGILSSLSVVLVFLASYLLFKKEEVGLFSSMIFALTPLSLYFSQVSEPRSVSIFFVCWALIVYLVALKEDSLKLWFLVSLVTSYSIYIRQENYVILLLFLLGFFLFGYRIDSTRLKRLIAPVSLFILLQSHVLLWLLVVKPFNHVSVWYKSMFSLSYFVPQISLYFKILFNYLPYGGHWYHDGLFALRFSALVSAVFFLGLFFVFEKKYRREKFFVFGWFFVFFGLNALYVNCDPDLLECDGPVRYAVMLVPAYAIIAGYAFFKAQAILRIGILKNAFLLIVFLLIFWTAKIDIPGTFFFDSRPVGRSDVIVATNRTPEGCVIIGLGPELVRSDLIKNNKRMTADIALVKDGDIVIQEASRGDCAIYFDWGPDYPDPIIGEKLAILNKYFEQEFLFREGHVTAFLLKPRKGND